VTLVARKGRSAARRAVATARFARYRLKPADMCLCGARGGRVLGSRRLLGRRWRLVECHSCGLGRLSPRLADGDLARFYVDEYRRERPIDRAYFERGVRRGERLFAYLESRGLLPPSGSTVVEAGTGAGGILAAFRAASYVVAGSDLDATAVSWARRQDLPVVMGEAVPLDLAPAPAGLVVLSHFVEHLPDPVGTVRALEPWLGNETRVYVEVPGLRSETPPAQQIRIPHLYYYDLESLTSVLGEAGLQLVEGDESVRAVFRRAA
jgi:Methyltransferase domain